MHMNKIMYLVIALVFGVVLLPVLIGVLNTTKAPQATVCETQANTTGNYTTPAAPNYVYQDDTGAYWCAEATTRPVTFTVGETLQPIVAAALPLNPYPGAGALLVLLPLIFVGMLLFIGAKAMKGGGGKADM